MNQGRRRFLRQAVHAAALGSIGAPLLSFPARAADTTGYKALVCVFLLGGLDNHDTLIPFDAASYTRFAGVRQALLADYRSISGSGGSNRERDRLLGLNLANAADYGSRRFALPEDMQGLRGLFDDGDAAIVSNVGPLLETVTRDRLEAPGVALPKRLFSHNDQQSTWMSGEPEGATSGWGGLFADAVVAGGDVGVGGVSGNDFVAMSALSNTAFLAGELSRPYQFTPSGAPGVRALQRIEWTRARPGGSSRYDALRRHFEATDADCRSLIECDYAAAMARSVQITERYNGALESAPTLGTQFPEGPLSGQLGAVARTIAARSSLGPSRQVFFVGMGGFDTHSRQADQLPQLQREIDGSIVAFSNAMKELGVSQDVALFTASDFGRTLTVNGDGTDHGWGAHHFVVGGGVRGGRLFGEVPPPELEHDFDSGNGRLIPTTSVDQFAASLGRWFGLNDSELQRALPGLSAFGGVSPQLFG